MCLIDTGVTWGCMENEGMQCQSSSAKYFKILIWNNKEQRWEFKKCGTNKCVYNGTMPFLHACTVVYLIPMIQCMCRRRDLNPGPSDQEKGSQITRTWARLMSATYVLLKEWYCTSSKHLCRHRVLLLLYFSRTCHRLECQIQSNQIFVVICTGYSRL